ncbi:hypothetical protein ACIBHX_24350 [Nonomuraea sp. NPDC050536]|uniref:hypothetical protein n=1 Tax=Nonomuraea sp. NPDC050536 TaxID=3364366 RepID=UPI0037CA77D0
MFLRVAWREVRLLGGRVACLDGAGPGRLGVELHTEQDRDVGDPQPDEEHDEDGPFDDVPDSHGDLTDAQHPPGLVGELPGEDDGDRADGHHDDQRCGSLAVRLSMPTHGGLSRPVGPSGGADARRT